MRAATQSPNPSSNGPGVACGDLVRPAVAELQALEIRCARAEGKNAIHQTESALRWMRDLLKAPVWTPALQAAWDMYRRGIDHALSGLPNSKL